MNHTQLLALTIGRVPGTAIRLDDPSVSASHAMISVHDGRLSLTDVGSTNGTFVNGQRVSSAFVTPHDRVLIGTVPFPWHHPNVAPLLAAVGAAATQPPPPSGRPTSTEVPASTPVYASVPDDDPPPPLPVSRIGRHLAIALALISLVGGGAAAAFFLVGRGSTALSPELYSGPSNTPWAHPPTQSRPLPPLNLAAPAASHLFADRMADQVDLRRQQERVEETRFRLWSQVHIDGWWLNNEARRPRTSWAVPLGLVDGPNGRSLAVGTTRCVIDYRYPHPNAESNLSDFRNLALFTGMEPNSGRGAQVFRISQPSDLIGQRTWDHVDGYLREPVLRTRYRQDLRQNPQWGVTAELVEGVWGDNNGVDFAILYFPLADPGTQALEPRTNRTLNMRDPRARMAEALGGRTNLWGNTIRFSLVSSECMAETARAFDARARSERMLQVFAVATAVVLVGVISGGLGTAMFASLRRPLETPSQASSNPASRAPWRRRPWAKSGAPSFAR